MIFKDKQDEKVFKNTVKYILSQSIGENYIIDVLDAIYNDVKEDVVLCSDDNGYSAADIQMAIGRVLISKLGILPF